MGDGDGMSGGSEKQYKIINSPLGWLEWPSSTWDYGPSQFNGRQYMPYTYQISKFYKDSKYGFNHSLNNEDYSYLDGTNKLKSVLDNFLGWEGEIVYKTDENGNFITEKYTYTDENGNQQEIEVKVVDTEKSKTDADSQSTLSRRVYKTFSKYPKLLDFQNMSLDSSAIGVNTITYDENSRETANGITTIEVEPLFQIKNLLYKFDLVFYRIVTSSSSTTNANVYENDFTFSPLHYVYNLTDFTLKDITSVPETKKVKFKFVQEAVELMDKVGTKYYSVLYTDKTTSESGELILDNTSIFSSKQAIQEAIYGIGAYKTDYVKHLPQLLTGYGKTRLNWCNEEAYCYYLLFEMMTILVASTLPLFLIFPNGTALAAAAWLKGIPTVLSKTRRELDAVSIGYQNRQNGDFFYNIGNKWEWIYRKNSGERLDLYDKFENPGFSMKKTNKNERTVKYNPVCSPVWSNRDFGSNLRKKYNPYTGEYEAYGLQYVERPFVMNGFLESDFKNYGLKRFKGSMSSTEKEKMKLYGKAIYHYDKYELEDGTSLTFTNYNFGDYTDLGNNTLQQKYTESETREDGQQENVEKYRYIKYKSKSTWENSGWMDYFTDKYKDWNEANTPLTHIYEGQKFSLTYMLNNNFRRTTMLVKMAYDYCKYLCDINNIQGSTRTISVQICSRLTINYFKKNLKLKRVTMSDEDNARINKKYFAEFENDWLVIYNKSDNKKIYFDFKTYIKDYKSHYGFSSGNNNVAVKSEIIPKLKKLYNGETLTDSTYKSWNTFYKNNINHINFNGTFSSVVKMNFDYGDGENYMENFLREYFGAMTDEELLEIYNEEMGLSGDKAKKNVVDTNSSSSNSLENNKELSRWINNSNEDSVTGNTTIEYLTANKIFNQQMWLNMKDGESYYSYGKKYPSYIVPTLNNNHITYDIRSLCLLYQVELEKILNYNAETLTEEASEKVQEKFYTYIDTDLENAITKKDVLDLIISKCQDIIPKQDYYMTIDEFNTILAADNKYKNYLDADNSNPNSLAYNLWVGYYVTPNNIKDILKELTTDGVSWATLLDKDGSISRGVNNNPMYISPFLPMYADVYKRLPYMCKVFLKKYCYTYDILSETISVMARDGWMPKNIRGFKVWGQVYLIAVIVIVVAIITFIPSGGNSVPIAAAIIASQVFAVIAAVSTVIALVLQCVAAASSNPDTQRRYRKAAQVFSLVAQVSGIASSVFSGIGSIGNLALEGAKTLAVLSALSLVANMISTYHSVKGHTKDAIGWSIASLVVGVAGKITAAKEAAKEAAKQAGKEVSQTSINYVNIIIPALNQMINIANQLMESIYSNNLENMQKEIALLEQKSKELEEQLKEEEAELVAEGWNANAALWSKKPLWLTQWTDSANLMLENSNVLPSTDTDDIIEATFEVLDS